MNMQNEDEKRPIRLFQDAIQRRREQNGDLDHLSDWQVHSAHITAGAIGSLASGDETGPLYVPMPTGSGKTTGAIWGIVDVVHKYPEQRICFLTPYTESVDNVFAQLARQIGEDVVGHFHHISFTDKAEELKKQVVVLTHQFVTSNPEKLDDRDLFIVDEAIYATGEATLKLEHILQARSWATRNNISAEAFNELADYASDLDRNLRQSAAKYLAPTSIDDKSWVEEIANQLDLKRYSQTIDDMECMRAVQLFCEALLVGLVFLTKGAIDAKRYDPVFSAALLGIPRLDKTVILSATGGMVYDIAGPFTQSQGVKHYWTPPSYQNLKLVRLTAPSFDGQYRIWGRHKNEVTTYVDWVLSEIPETTVYLTVPKQVLETCLREYLGISQKGEIANLPITTTKHGKTVQVSTHARSVGSNQFKDCEAVVYLWEDYKPQQVSVQRFHTLANEPVTDEALAEANRGKLAGNYQRIRDAQIIDTMMQQIGRGRVRAIDDNAIADSMTAYVLCSANYFERLAAQYRDCKTGLLEYPNIDADKPTGRIPQIINYLRERHPKEDVPFTEVEQAVGFKLRGYRHILENDWDLVMLGYQFVAGERGRGRTGHFKRLGK